jgi:hypothetical protein
MSLDTASSIVTVATPDIVTERHTELNNAMNQILFTLSEDQMEKHVVVEYRPEREAYEFLQQKNYRISEEFYVNWPKFYSIEVDEKDKNIITLSFRGKPNMNNIENLLRKAGASYEIDDFPNIASIMLLTIKTNTDKALVYLMDKYRKFSFEAASHLWEVYRVVIENSMDLKNKKWKTALSSAVDAWADEEQLSEDFKCNLENESETSSSAEWFYNSECDIKSIYIGLSSEDKNRFKKAIYKNRIFQNAVMVAAGIINDDDKLNPFEMSLKDSDKCRDYIIANFPLYKNVIDNILNEAGSIFVKTFEPGFFEKLFDEKKWDKHLKSGSAFTKSYLSLADRFIYTSKNLKSFTTIFDTVNLVTSLVYFSREFSSPNKNEDYSLKLDESSLGKDLVAVSMVCNNEYFISLNKDSLTSLIQFYADFSKLMINANSKIAIESNPALYLFQNSTDIAYIQSINININAKLLDNSGNEKSILEFLKEQNFNRCIENVKNTLSANDININEEDIINSSANNSTTTLNITESSEVNFTYQYPYSSVLNVAEESQCYLGIALTE